MTALAPPLDLEGTTLVVGLGRSGLSAVRVLRALGAGVVVADSRPEPPGLASLTREHPEVAMHLGGFDTALFEVAGRLVVSPGVALDTPAVKAAAGRGIEVMGDVELFARLARVPVAAITGSNGKSTVTTLLGLMARRAGRSVAVGGNLGTPALDLWLAHEAPGAREPVDLYVLELSSFQLETVASLDARVATVLNISPDHMDRYEDVEGYARAKARIFAGRGRMVINRDDALVAAMARPDRPQTGFTLGSPRGRDLGVVERGGQAWLGRAGEPWLAAAELGIGGTHNLANALAALAMGDALGLEREAMLSALREFTGLPHRSQLVLERDGVRWVDDSKGTNVGASVAAIGGVAGPVVLIAGGDGKGQSFEPLARALQGKARAVILIGRDAPLLEVALRGVAPLHAAPTLEAAVERAAGLARSGDCVLLSPACASFDMFSGYEERGRVFADAVRRLVP